MDFLLVAEKEVAVARGGLVIAAEVDSIDPDSEAVFFSLSGATVVAGGTSEPDAKPAAVGGGGLSVVMTISSLMMAVDGVVMGGRSDGGVVMGGRSDGGVVMGGMSDGGVVMGGMSDGGVSRIAILSDTTGSAEQKTCFPLKKANSNEWHNK